MPPFNPSIARSTHAKAERERVITRFQELNTLPSNTDADSLKDKAAVVEELASIVRDCVALGVGAALCSTARMQRSCG